MNDDEDRWIKEKTIDRHRTFTKEELVEHIKTVGQTIIQDAETIALDPKVAYSIEIVAKIEATKEITDLTYILKRHADPRLEIGERGG